MINGSQVITAELRCARGHTLRVEVVQVADIPQACECGMDLWVDEWEFPPVGVDNG